MFDFNLDQRSLNAWVGSFNRTIVANMKLAQEEIRRDWGYELYRQHLRKTSDNSTAPARALIPWPDLPSSYVEDKKRQGYSGLMLKRTGDMLAGYVDGIHIDPTESSMTVTMPFPTGPDSEGRDMEVRAKAHQGAGGRPAGMPLRPFAIEGFAAIAVDRYQGAIEISLQQFNSKGKAIKPRKGGNSVAYARWRS